MFVVKKIAGYEQIVYAIWLTIDVYNELDRLRHANNLVIIKLARSLNSSILYHVKFHGD